MSYLEWCESLEPFESRLGLAKSGQKSYDANCYGTGLFLAGILPYDVVVFSEGKFYSNLEELVSLMEEVDSPRDNSIWINESSAGEIVHLTYVEKAFPLRAWCRKGRRMAPFGEINSIQEAHQGLQEVFSHRIDCGEIEPEFTNRYFLFSRDKLSDWSKKIVGEYSPSYWA